MIAPPALSRAERIFGLLELGRSRQASDLHVEPSEGAALRIYTVVERIPGIRVEPEEVEAFLSETLDKLALARLAKLGLADAVYNDSRVGPIRIHASRGRRSSRLAIRLLARAIPELETLNLPPVVESFAECRSGLTLVVGPTGSGKSTTIASILDRINCTSAKHIVTLESPIEYVHRWSRSVVTQYEVGRDVATFPDGVIGSMRADPDVIFIGELRELETVTACLQAAETGHVVFAALHTPSETPLAVNRIVGLFPAHEQETARIRFADALRAIVGMRLVPLRDGTGLRAAVEVVVANEAVRRIIRDGATHQLRASIATSRRDGSQTLESHLTELVASGEIDIAAARAVSAYPEEIRDVASPLVRRR